VTLAPGVIAPLHLADVTYPEGHPRSGVGPVFAFAVGSPRGVVLVDTGIGPAHPVIDRLYRPARHPCDAALGARGIAPGDVVAVVNTHLHFDHCGGNARFAGVPAFVQEAEYTASREPAYTVPDFVDFPGARYELLSGEHEVAPGVRILPTPGHTPGHQSVEVETPEGIAVIAGQAVETLAEYAGDAPLTDVTAAASLERLRALAPARVYFSHDAAVWRPKG
jgi:N-acyl homoserine lactone hydrolase